MKLFTWRKIARPVWTALLSGFLWVVFAILTNFKIAASGAGMVCACIIADLLFQQLEWRRQVNRLDIYQVKGPNDTETYTDNRPGWSPEVTISDKMMPFLRQLANANEDDDAKGWSVYKTARRVERVITIAISLRAIAGTIIWGYVPQ